MIYHLIRNNIPGKFGKSFFINHIAYTSRTYFRKKKYEIIDRHTHIYIYTIIIYIKQQYVMHGKYDFFTRE